MKATLATSPADAPTVEAPGPDLSAIDAALEVAARHTDPRAQPAPAAIAVTPAAVPDVDLSNAPALLPVKRLRARQRVSLYRTMMEMSERLSSDQTSADGTVEISVNDLEVIADIEELLERFAVVPAEYAEWVTEEGGGPDPDSRVIALFSAYAEQLGEPAPSTT